MIRLPEMSLKSLTYSRLEDGVVTFEDENGYTIDCKVCNVKNLEKYNENDIVIAIINDENGNITIELLQKNQEEMTRRAEKVAAAERILSETIGKPR